MVMSISSIQLDAFFEVAKLLNFSKAAAALGVTQSALSQRVKNLELDLGVTLFIRETGAIRLTDSGEKLLRYCLVRTSIEGDVLSEIQSAYDDKKDDGLTGVIRIASYSSVLRSIIIPALAPFLRGNPNVQCEFIKGEMGKLAEMLKTGEADFIILDHALSKTGIAQDKLGNEEYIVIESSKYTSRTGIYLDHNPEDTVTESFFQKQAKGTPKGFRRSFMGDIYGILDGVEQGLGRAIVSKHLIKKNKNIKKVSGFSKYSLEVTLHHYERPYYPRLLKEVHKQILAETKKLL
jgi:DNA-binding transcriptional LysR family regulator